MEKSQVYISSQPVPSLRSIQTAKLFSLRIWVAAASASFAETQAVFDDHHITEGDIDMFRVEPHARAPHGGDNPPPIGIFAEKGGLHQGGIGYCPGQLFRVLIFLGPADPDGNGLGGTLAITDDLQAPVLSTVLPGHPETAADRL